MNTADELRQNMVRQQLLARGVRDASVLRAMGQVPREAFVPAEWREYAYDDSPLPIGHEQTISQPYVVALMIEALGLSAEDRALEIGTGSGYGAAVLSRIVACVYTVERHQELADAAAERFRRLGYDNIKVRHGDGTLGWPEHAPYNGIVVTAGSPHVPLPLQDQLAIGGRLVIPVGSTLTAQELLRLERIDDAELRQENLGAVRFVPLVGKRGWRG